MAIDEGQEEVFLRSVRAFVDLAQDHSLSLTTELAKLQTVLADLYTCACRVQPAEQKLQMLSTAKNEFVRKRVLRRFQTLSLQYYFQVLDEDEAEEDDGIVGDLQEDLMEMYDSLVEGLAVLEQGTPADAVAQLQRSFQEIWGQRLLCVLLLVHELRDMEIQESLG